MASSINDHDLRAFRVGKWSSTYKALLYCTMHMHGGLIIQCRVFCTLVLSLFRIAMGYWYTCKHELSYSSHESNKGDTEEYVSKRLETTFSYLPLTHQLCLCSVYWTL